eukprot:s608_g22.t1
MSGCRGHLSLEHFSGLSRRGAPPDLAGAHLQTCLEKTSWRTDGCCCYWGLGMPQQAPKIEKYKKGCPSKCIFPECQYNNVTQRTLFGRSY